MRQRAESAQVPTVPILCLCVRQSRMLDAVVSRRHRNTQQISSRLRLVGPVQALYPRCTVPAIDKKGKFRSSAFRSGRTDRRREPLLSTIIRSRCQPLTRGSEGRQASGRRSERTSFRRELLMDVDVFIAGGGLAGLTLARQLRRTDPTLRIAVAEKRRHPAPEAAHKVGESSVEIGAHYFEKVLDLESHLRCRPSRKTRASLSLSPAATIVTSRRGSSSGRRSFRRCRHFSSIVGGSKTTCSRQNREAGIEVLDQAVVRDVHVRHAAPDRRGDTRRRALVPGALARRCKRSRRTASTAPRSHQAGWSPRQRLLVPPAQLRPHRRLERRHPSGRRTCRAACAGTAPPI